MVSWFRREFFKQLALVITMVFALQPDLVVAKEQANQASKVQQIELQLGESYYLTLQGENLAESYQQLDFSQLKQHFYFDDSAQTSYRIRIKLTPFQAGEFVQPGLVAGSLQVPALHFKVKENPLVAIDWQVSANKIYQNQAVSWLAKVKVLDKALPSKLSKSEQPNVFFEETALSQKIDSSFKLEAFAQAEKFPVAGKFQASLPSIQVTSRRGERWEFYPAPEIIEVLPIPSYLPLNLPVGEFELQFNRKKIYFTNQLASFDLQIKAINSGNLPDLRKSLQIETETIEWLTANRETKQQIMQPGLVVEQKLQQPLRILHSGFGQLPELKFNYLDPKTGKLMQIVLPASSYFALPKWLAYLLGLLALMLLITAIILVYPWLRIGFFNAKLKLDLALARTPQASWKAYRSWGKYRGLQNYQTNQAWLESYQQKFGQEFAEKGLLNQLEQQIYQPKN